MDKQKRQALLITVMILIAVVSRFLPHWHNFTAVGAVGLFAGAYFTRKYWAFFIPLVALWISDLALNNLVYAHYYEGFVWFTQGAFWIYLGFALNVVIGMFIIKRFKVGSILVGAILASLAFFLVSNFGAWVSPLPPHFPATFSGLLAAYGAGLPFLLNSLLANIFFSFVLFGGYEFISVKIGLKDQSFA